MKGRLARHVLAPLSAPVALVALYFTPKDVFGCANRGLMAMAVVLLATVGALVAAWKGVSRRRRGLDAEANWWLLTTVILLLPIALLAGPLG